MTESEPALADWERACRDWLAGVVPRRSLDEGVWGTGSDEIAVFHNLTPDAERAVLADIRAWQATRYEAGFGAITWEREYGGAGLSPAHEQVFFEVESEFAVPDGHETLDVTVNLIAPTVREFGTPEQTDRFVIPFLRADAICCQLFSEPDAGSDLANVATRAERQGDEWVVTGQKVWSSGAQFAEWGELIARTDPSAPKHQGMTAFLVPLSLPGVTVRPIRQMSGGSTFNEVFFDGAVLHDRYRLGARGEGWKVALTTLGFERSTSGRSRTIGGSWEQLAALARWSGQAGDPAVRRQLSALYMDLQLAQLSRARAVAAARAGRAPGPEGSTGKLVWAQNLARMSEVASSLLGPRLAGDTGEWGTYAWTGHVLGAPGYRIAGGSDEVQRNIIGERVLGLPPEPRGDKNRPWRRTAEGAR